MFFISIDLLAQAMETADLPIAGSSSSTDSSNIHDEEHCPPAEVQIVTPQPRARPTRQDDQREATAVFEPQPSTSAQTDAATVSTRYGMGTTSAMSGIEGHVLQIVEPRTDPNAWYNTATYQVVLVYDVDNELETVQIINNEEGQGTS